MDQPTLAPSIKKGMVVVGVLKEVADDRVAGVDCVLTLSVLQRGVGGRECVRKKNISAFSKKGRK